eukprot:TRINITY_DN68177_c5_g1_i1.p2 TRINITY_DN68177_c5_g1~~TRINITY_DN68177_c5_g1_i1.p2  ORF type:complete len:105 (-),score=0.19 TRINITY_DN68177_c5_g1_i1:877-1191(-)
MMPGHPVHAACHPYVLRQGVYHVTSLNWVVGSLRCTQCYNTNTAVQWVKIIVLKLNPKPNKVQVLVTGSKFFHKHQESNALVEVFKETLFCHSNGCLVVETIQP